MRKLDWAQQLPRTFHFLPLCSDWINSIEYRFFFLYHLYRFVFSVVFFNSTVRLGPPFISSVIAEMFCHFYLSQEYLQLPLKYSFDGYFKILDNSNIRFFLVTSSVDLPIQVVVVLFVAVIMGDSSSGGLDVTLGDPV